MGTDLFSKRMNALYGSPSDISNTLARKAARDSVAISEVTFTNDPNYKRGMLYDWELNEIEEVDFKFQKYKTHTIDNDEIEYSVQFRAGFNPEKRYKDLYYRKDGRERTGFYIDVEDENTGDMEKWLICKKDDKVYFDRYIVLKCNWCFEWINKKDGKYHQCLGCLREANSYTSGVWSDGISTTLNDITSFIMPSRKEVSDIEYGTRFMISDSETVPKVYKVTKNLSTFPIGITKFTISQSYFNEHMDYFGKIEGLEKLQLTIDDDMYDLPEKFGGEYHMICDLIKSKPIIKGEMEDDESEVEKNGDNEKITWSISEVAGKLIVNGNPKIVKAVPSIKTKELFEGKWNIYVDNEPYSIEDLDGYFKIEESDNSISITAINKVMEKYIVRIELVDKANVVIGDVEMEVSL